jgi:uracil phosphoribosyltransferase
MTDSTSTINDTAEQHQQANNNTTRQQHPQQQHEHNEYRYQLLKQQYPHHLYIQPQTPYLLYLHTIIRNQDTSTQHFIYYSNILLTTLIQYALNYCTSLYNLSYPVMTPTQCQFNGYMFDTSKLCCVSILRAAESMELSIRSIIPDISIGKILIQRDEQSEDKHAELYYCKLPTLLTQPASHHDVTSDITILLLDPMLASGNSSLLAISTLLDKCQHLHIKASNILFITLVATEIGIKRLLSVYPDLRIVTSMVDDRLNEEKYICPGLGDFGDRYFGT